MVDGLDSSSLIQGIDEVSKDSAGGKKLQILAEAFEESKGQHDFWAWKFYFCEFLTLANLIFQYTITNTFLVDHLNLVALGGLKTNEHVSVMPITGTCKFRT